MNPMGQNRNFQNILPPQQVLQVQGKPSIDMLQMSPNSSLLAMDMTAPIVWLCVSDGIGRVTATPYDISPHKEPEPVDNNTLMGRITALESTMSRVEGLLYGLQSYDGRARNGYGAAANEPADNQSPVSSN